MTPWQAIEAQRMTPTVVRSWTISAGQASRLPTGQRMHNATAHSIEVICWLASGTCELVDHVPGLAIERPPFTDTWVVTRS